MKFERYFIEVWMGHDGKYRQEKPEEMVDFDECLAATPIFGYTIAIFKIRFK